MEALGIKNKILVKIENWFVNLLFYFYGKDMESIKKRFYHRVSRSMNRVTLFFYSMILR